MLPDHVLEMMTEEVDQMQQLGFGNRPDVDVLVRETLNDEIHQVIFKESLNEAVMSLVLNAENNGLDSSSQFPLFEAEGNDARNANAACGIDGVYDEKEGPKGNYENQGAEENDKLYTYEERRRESIGDHMFTNEDAGPGGGWRPGERSNIYPVRPDAEDCAYYMKTGTCKFGATCKFNHTFKKKIQSIKVKHKTRIEDLEKQGPNECKYYLTPGGCKYGKACKYNHIRERNAVSPILEFNFLGLPIRLGEKECPYYLRHGSCKYGPSCKFNHPQPTSVATTEPAPSYSVGGSVPFQSSAQLTTSSWSAMSMLLPANQHVPMSNPDWNGYPQAQVYPTTSVRSLPTPPAFTVNNMAGEANSFARHQQLMPNDEYPERPGEPECSYFLKTGDCKFKSNCRFHHPKDRLHNSTSCALSAKGLPLRPDQSVCSFYNRYGICKFGPACKFDHPENWGNFAFSGGARMLPRKEREANLT